MGLVVVVLAVAAGLLFVIGSLIQRNITLNKLAGKEADREAQRDEANARKNAPWSLNIKHEGSVGVGKGREVVFYAHRVFYSRNFPSGSEQGTVIELARLTRGEKNLTDMKEEFDAARFTAQQLVSDLEEVRVQQG